MFDVSFSELMVIAVVALLVIGPEKLPKVARTVGAFMGRMQRYMTQVKEEVNREMRFEELQKLQKEIKQSVEQKALQIETETAALGAALQPSIDAPFRPTDTEQNNDEIALSDAPKMAVAPKSTKTKKMTADNNPPEQNTISKSQPKKRTAKKSTSTEVLPESQAALPLNDPN